MDKLVSIVLPVYNGEKYLRESIESVIAQTYTNWELLIVDDCSKDSTAAIAKEYAERDVRIRYYLNENNLRLPRNLNKGFSLAEGEYLTWTSDDNNFKPTAIERMAEKLDGGAQFVFASCRIIDENGAEFEYISVHEASVKYIVGQNSVGACFMYTREVYEAVGDYDPEYTLVEDFDYWQRIISRFKTAIISDILYEYRLHSGSLTGTLKKEELNTTMEKMLLKNRPLFGKLDYERSYYYYKGLYNCRLNCGEKRNDYSLKYKLYSFVFFIRKRVPAKIKRMLKK